MLAPPLRRRPGAELRDRSLTKRNRHATPLRESQAPRGHGGIGPSVQLRGAALSQPAPMRGHTVDKPTRYGNASVHHAWFTWTRNGAPGLGTYRENRVAKRSAA